MRALELNLATRPFRNNTLLWISHVLLAAGVVVFTAWNTTTFLETGRKLRQLRSNVGSIESRMHDVETREHRATVEIGKHDLKYLVTQTVRANDVIQRKALSWTRLFNLLEEVQPYEVKMVSIRPVFGAANQGQSPLLAAKPEEVVPVSVEGSAKDLSAFLDFERSLIDDPHFDRVEPERTTHTKNGELLFGLAFLYYPEGQTNKQASSAAATRAAVPQPKKAEQGSGSAAEGPGAGEEPEEPEAANVQDAWKGATPPPQQAKAGPKAVPPAPVPAPAKPPAKIADSSPTRDGSAGEPGAQGTPAAAPKFRMPVHEVPQTPLRKRPENWQPPTSPPPKPPDDSGER